MALSSAPKARATAPRARRPRATTRRRTDERAVAIVRALAPGALVALPAAPWLALAAARASFAPLGRDQGIFQYTAWAVAGGARAYRDVRDVNGPLVLLVHTIFQALGGTDEHVFRTLDLALVFATTAFVGASLVALEPAPPLDPPPSTGARRVRIARALALALAAVAILGTQYVAYGSWDTAQRESFFDAFVLVAVGAQLFGQARARGRLALAAIALAGAASLAPWLGKPTYALFTAVQILALALDGARAERLRRIGAFAAGGVLGAAVPFAFLALRGDVGAWARITFVDVPAMYRFIWPRTAAGVLGLHRDATTLALVTSFAVLVLVAVGRMPRRALPIALLPLAGLGSALVQAKGFLYHFHPVSLGAHLALLTLAHHAWVDAEGRARAQPHERAHPARRAPRARKAHLVAAAFTLALGARTAWDASRAATLYLPTPDSTGTIAGGATGEDRLAAYTRIDFFPVPMKHASELLARRTSPNETVQVYGMDPYVLFLARRRSATPYIYAYDLDADAALAGSFEEGGLRPTPAQQARIRAMRDDHERDMLAALERAPPAAFVFIGRAPLMAQPDALRDFEDHCPGAARWFFLRYREAAVFDDVRVWLRDDVDVRDADAP